MEPAELIAKCKEYLEQQGFTVTRKLQTVNPLNHSLPHAKLRNVTLTSIERLRKNCTYPTIGNNDDRNFVISRQVQPYYGLLMQARADLLDKRKSSCT